MTKNKQSTAYDRFSKIVDGPLLIVALLWVPLLIIPYIYKISPSTSATFQAIDDFVWALFLVEYLTKVYLSPNKISFVRSHIPDLIVVVIPFLRPLRLLRVMRILRISRVVSLMLEALRRAKSILTHQGLHFVLLAAMAIVFVAASAEYLFEHKAKGANIHSFGGALWWAITTITTVGYGDRYPVTAAGRGIAVVLMLTGIGLVGVLTATIASYFIEQEKSSSIDAKLEQIEIMLRSLLEKQDPR